MRGLLDEEKLMWKKSVVCLVLSYFMVLGIEVVNGKDIPEKIIIDKGVYRTDIYEEVPFSHGDHIGQYNIACEVCHHTWNKYDKKIPDRCDECHSVKEDVKFVLRDAYMKQCRGCHGKLKSEGRVSGPTRCNECHKKKKRLK